MPEPSPDALETIRADTIAAVIRAPSVHDPVRLAQCLADGGIRCVEFTFTIPGVEQLIAQAVEAETGAVVGAGTVLSAEQASSAIAAGARFVVSPTLAPDVVPICREHGVRVFLGAFTPTEVVRAMSLGADAVKIFPAGVGGSRYLRELRGPLPDVPMIPSGGVTVETAPQFLAEGAIAVFAGSDLSPADAIREGDYAEIQRRAKLFGSALGH